jgi:DNA-binding transcriptional LysR family regulator
MRFQHYDALRVFALVARHGSFSAAAEALNLTKGAVSYQIRVLEQALGFALFHRQPRGVTLTAKARDLAAALQFAFPLPRL